MAIAAEELAGGAESALGRRTAAGLGRNDLSDDEARTYGHRVSEALRKGANIPHPPQRPEAPAPASRAPRAASPPPARRASPASAGGSRGGGSASRDLLYRSLPSGGAGGVPRLITAAIAGLVVLEIVGQMAGKKFNVTLGGWGAGKNAGVHATAASATSTSGKLVPLYPGQQQDLAALFGAGHASSVGNTMPGIAGPVHL